MHAVDFITQCKYTIYIFGIGIFNWLGVPVEGFVILSFLTLFDWITGIIKQYTINPQGITSARSWLGVVKKLSTLLLFFLVALVFKAIDINDGPYLKTILAILIISEGYSILQNIYTIRTGKVVKEFDAVSITIQNIQGYFEKLFSRMNPFDERSVHISKEEKENTKEKK